MSKYRKDNDIIFEDETLTVRKLSPNEDLSHYFNELHQELDETPKENLPTFDKIYIVKSTEICWKCSCTTPVFSFACSNSEDSENSFFMMAFVHSLANNLIRAIQKHSKSYFLDYSKKASTNYYMNHCSYCNAKIGDFYMYYQPGSSFYPKDKINCDQMVIYDIKHDQRNKQPCQCELIPQPLIRQYAVIHQLSKKTIASQLKSFFLRVFQIS